MMPKLSDLLERESRTVGLKPDSFGRLLRRRDRKRRNQRLTAGVVAIAVFVGAMWFLAGRFSNRTPTPADQPTMTSVPPVWSPVREPGDLAIHRGSRWQDPQDAAVGWVDVTSVRFSVLKYTDGSLQPGWSIELAAQPPPAAGLEAGRLIAYGLVLDTTGDGVADYLIGIDNDAPEQGDFHVWVTDLATGETDEQIGPPYGFPIEFAHPDEEGGSSTMMFTFLPGTAPADLNPQTVRFYAWASATSGGEVFAWDYAPDKGWITRRP